MSTGYAHDLIDKAKNGDKAAAEKLIEANTGLIWSIARRYFGCGIDSDDLYQLGCLGFIKAVQSFDTEYGTQFSTYAVPKISGEIRRFIRDDGAVKVSRSMKERAQSIKSARTTLEQKLGREPTVSEIGALTGLTREEIASAETAVSAAASLQQENGEDGLTLEEMLGDYAQEERMIESIALRSALMKLSERERKVVALRYYRGLTQSNTARLMKISQVQVSRLERKAVESLRKYLQ